MNDEQTAVALRRAATALGRRLREERAAEGPGRLGLALLGHLHRRGAMTAGELAAAEHLQPQSVTRVLASLDAHGLIRRSRNPDDRRQHHIVITDQGSAVLLEQVADSDRWLARRMAESLTPAERQILQIAADLLGKLLDRPGPPGG
ncbi:MarR family winged helix-turn-helix transcriptional regulator [Nonomuraea sediminis]|uniref:MarR family winged helix-turn-helix transcriptional regulator n=1 Tax=Nonomuraea sediminis TaxID=2835864 RepID=UPI001BDBC185|nr:MarR family transcriptional regulator [Nonomuraea sediminis]